MKHYRLPLLILTTFLLWYGIFSFIEWDFGWIQYATVYASPLNRSFFVLAIIIKLVIDFWLWSYIRDKWFDDYVDEDKKLEKENQEKLRKTFN
jgi:hypothetical protein